MQPSTHPLFWRNRELPFVELRQVLDGREVTYAPHTHEEWSIGAIINGQSEFLCADRLHQVEQGTLVMMNPDVVHACNPKQDSPWAYYMMHLDKNWLATLLHDPNIRECIEWMDTPIDTLVSDEFYVSFITLCRQLMSDSKTNAEKEALLRRYFVSLFEHISALDSQIKPSTLLPNNSLYQVADYLEQSCLEDISIENISAEFGFSTSYLVRAFKRHFNMTPHAYRLNRRVQLGQQALKQGQSIADIAQTIGFSDQAHFQRTFKQRVAATPEQYRRNQVS